MKVPASLLFIGLIFYFSVTNAQVGAPGSFEKYEFQPEAFALTEYSSGSVNEHGDYQTNVSIGSVSSPSGISFQFGIQYSSNIRYDDVAGWLGMGWTANIGTINRSVRGSYLPIVDQMEVHDYTYANPVDFPSNVHAGYWDGDKDLYYISLPDGTNLECVYNNAVSGDIDEFLVLNNYGYTVLGKYGAISITDQNNNTMAIGQSKNYAVNGYVNGNVIADYHSFLVTDPTGVRYLFKKPSLELNEGPGGNQSLYVSTWRIVTMMSSYYNGSEWTSDNESNKVNKILFHYTNEVIRTGIKNYTPNNYLFLIAGQSSYYEYCNHIMYVNKIEAINERLVFTYINDNDVDRNSKYKVLSNGSSSDPQASSSPKPIYSVTNNEDRKRIQRVEIEKKTGSNWYDFKSIDFVYESYFNRTFLATVSSPELENNYSFSYTDVENNSNADFDYSLIWAYHTAAGGDLEIKYFDELYSQMAKPFDINGFFKKRNTTDTIPSQYYDFCNPGFGQLEKIIYPTGRIESIRYNRYYVEDRWDVQGINQYAIKTLPISFTAWNGSSFVQVEQDQLGVYSTKHYFNGIDGFFKSCPDSIIITDAVSPKSTIYSYSFSNPQFPGSVSEMNFNNWMKIKKLGQSLPPPVTYSGYTINGLRNYSFSSYRLTHGGSELMPDQTLSEGIVPFDAFLLTENYTDSRTNVQYHSGDIILFFGRFDDPLNNWTIVTPDAIDPVYSYIEGLNSIQSRIMPKAARVMDIEDKVWFGRINKSVNGISYEAKETSVVDKQPIGLICYQLPGNVYQLVVSTSNWHLVNIQENISKGGKDESVLLKESIKKYDVWGGHEKITQKLFNGVGTNGSEDYTVRWRFKKQPSVVQVEGNVISKSINHYDHMGNLRISAVNKGKIDSLYQFEITYNRYAYQEPSIGAPSHKANLPVQVINGFFAVDSTIFIDNPELFHRIEVLADNFDEVLSMTTNRDSVYKFTDSRFKLTNNMVYKYKTFSNSVFGVYEVYSVRNWKTWQFQAWNSTQQPGLNNWLKQYTIESYSSFGTPLTVNYSRFKEYYYFGSQSNVYNTDENQIYWFKPTARKIVNQQFNSVQYSFTAKYNNLGLVTESSAPNNTVYKYYYDALNRMIKITRNNTVIKRNYYNFNRGTSYLRISSVAYNSVSDSIITTEFFDGFGLVQTFMGNQSQLIVSEPVFNNRWDKIGTTLPFKLETGNYGFVNPFNHSFLTAVSNGGNLNFDKYNEFPSNDNLYDFSYSNSKRQNSVIGSNGNYPLITSSTTSLQSLTVSQQAGEDLRELGKNKKTLNGGLTGDYSVTFSFDEDNFVNFSIVEADGRILFEGKTNLNSISSDFSQSIAGLLNKIVSAPTPTQGTVDSIAGSGSGSGTGSGGVSVDPFDPPCSIIDYDNGVDRKSCKSGMVFEPNPQSNEPGGNYTNIEVFSAQVYARALDFIRIPITNLNENQTINLRGSSLTGTNWEIIKSIHGPISNDTLLIFPVQPGRVYKFDFWEDFNWHIQLGPTPPEPAKFLRVSLPELKVLSLTSYQYNDLNQLVAVIHPDGTKTEYVYDFFGRVVKKETPYHNAKLKNVNKPESDVNANPDFEYIYDQYGQLRFSIDPNQSNTGKMSVSVYDGIGRVIESGEMNSAGRFTSANAENFLYPFSYPVNNGGPALEPTDRSGMSTPSDYKWQQQFYYDLNDSSMGRLSQVIDYVPKPDGSMGNLVKTMRYRKEGWVADVTTAYPNGVTQVEYFDKPDFQGKPAETRLTLNGTLYRKGWYEYTPFGQVSKVYFSRNTTKPVTPHFTYTWDGSGRMVKKVIGPISSTLNLSFSPEQWLSEINFYRSSPSAPLLKLRYNYFDNSMLSGQTIAKCYAGNIAQMATMYGNETTEQFDAFFYDDLNRLTARDSDVKSNTGNVTQNVYSTSYRYDGMGNILQLQRNWQDPFTSQVTQKDNFQYQYAGNKLMNLVDLSPVTTTDARNVVTVSNTITGNPDYYNTTYQGVNDNFELYNNGNGVPSTYFSSTAAAAKIVIATDGSNGKVLKLSPTSTSTPTTLAFDTVQVVGYRTYKLSLKYKNDHVFDGEITQLKTKITVAIKWYTAENTYISASNLLSNVASQNWISTSKTITAPSTAAYAVVVLTSAYRSVDANGFAWFDNVAFEETNRSYAYDANGNTVTDNIRGITGIVYNFLNLPIQLTNQSQTVTYGYTWSGSRWWKKTPTVTNYYLRSSDGSILGEYTNSLSSLKYLSLPGASGTEGQWEMSGTVFINEFFYVTDHLGNNRLTVRNNSGDAVIVNKTDYYPFGSVAREWTNTTPDIGKFKYQQKERDLETGYDYFEARIFDSQTGRFMQVDPMYEKFKSVSSFVGMNNNPVQIIDPTGMVWENPEDAATLKAGARKRITELNADNEKRSSADTEGWNEDEIQENQAQIEENNQMIGLLEQSISDIDAIGNAEEVFRIVPGSDENGVAGVRQNSDGVIEIGGNTSAAQVHEIRHIGDSFRSGGMKWDKDNFLANPGKTLEGKINVEVRGYQTGFAYDNGSYPVDGTKHLSQINGNTLFMIKDHKGNIVYEKLRGKK